MKKSLLLATMLAMVLCTNGPVMAQPVEEGPGSEGGAIAQPYGTPAPPDTADYALTDDGTVLVDGDSAMDCRTFAISYEQGYDRTGDPEQAQAVLEQCEQRGLLPSGEEAAPVDSVPAQEQQYQQPAPEAQGAIAQPYGEAPPPALPYYVYNGDGTVTIDSDTGTSCRDFLRSLEDGSLHSVSDQYALAQSVLEQCEQDGFLSSGGEATPVAQEQPRQTSRVSELPATGGTNLPLATLVAGTAVVVGLGGLMKVSRR